MSDRRHPLESHHRRIRRKAWVVHFGLLPLAVAVPLIWVYLALGVCQDAQTPWSIAGCRVFGWTPVLPALFGFALVAWIGWDLAVVGAHLRERRPAWRHAAHGYRSIDSRHRRHFHWAFAQALIVGLALVSFLLFLVYRTTY